MKNSLTSRHMQAARLKAARETAGFLTAAAAIQKHGWKQSTYLAHENGQNGLSTDAAIAYGSAFGVEPGWLLTGVGRGDGTGMVVRHPDGPRPPRPQAVPTSDLDLRSLPRDLPVLGSGKCGKDGLFEFNGQTLDHVRRPPRLVGVPGAYALYASDHSMSPWREDGSLVYVHPTLPVKPGDYVVVQLHPESDGQAPPAYIKKLVRRSASEITVLQYNPRKELTISTKNLLTMHKVIDLDELMSF